MTRRQTNAAAFLVGLSPLLHVVPSAQVKALGGAGWLGCAVALPVLLALFLQTMYGAVDLLVVGRFGTIAPWTTVCCHGIIHR